MYKNLVSNMHGCIFKSNCIIQNSEVELPVIYKVYKTALFLDHQILKIPKEILCVKHSCKSVNVTFKVLHLVIWSTFLF